MAKITETFLTLLTILLYTSHCSQGAAEYDGFTARSPVPSPFAHLPDSTIQVRIVCAPCHCCVGDPSCPQRPACCMKLTCNQPHDPLGACIVEQLACNCNNCPV
ncbi:hypothetical protein PVAP13_3KG377400 [Panicum virgatum]|uniref:DUF7866 domain-containing protein n=1 Tax=Panicum virgatum TaxID=38727 RepID=A0A8T0V1J2_PANVG|nr:hypothetical protein PVAP13_3KG377400 [Panicum virgatum]